MVRFIAEFRRLQASDRQKLSMRATCVGRVTYNCRAVASLFWAQSQTKRSICLKL